MARPQFIQQLRHGKLITQSNYPQFVETYNYAVNRIDNLKGDRDTNPQSGRITVDNTDAEHPVIRFHEDASDVSGYVECDEKSIDKNLSGQVQVYDWETLSNEVSCGNDELTNYNIVARDKGDSSLKYLALALSSGGGTGDTIEDFSIVLSSDSDYTQHPHALRLKTTTQSRYIETTLLTEINLSYNEDSEA